MKITDTDWNHMDIFQPKIGVVIEVLDDDNDTNQTIASSLDIKNKSVMTYKKNVGVVYCKLWRYLNENN